jgi:Domain of unknown function (DUF4190)
VGGAGFIQRGGDFSKSDRLLVTCIGLLSIPAVICGHMALHQIKNSPRIVAGRGMALAGLICGYLALLMVGAGLAMLILGIARTH